MKIDEFIQKIPKAELNVHLEGCLEPELILKLAKRNKIQIPYTSVEEIRKSYQFEDLPEFLKIYYANLQVLITEQDFYDLTFAYLKKAVSQNIRHVEISFDAQAHTSRGIQLQTVINGIYRAIQDGEKQLKISAYLILSFMRNLSESDAEKLFTEALTYKDWIVAIGLDSTEIGNPPEKFKSLFERAGENGFLTVATAGETGPASYIVQAIDILKVTRIDQGVACMQDPDLVTRLSATQIPLDLCPISNVKLGVVDSMRQHPLKRMYEEGLCVTVNSDDPAYFNAYLNENFMQANAALKLNKVIIYELVKNSFNASFLSSEKKEEFLEELEKFYKHACTEKI